MNTIRMRNVFKTTGNGIYNFDHKIYPYTDAVSLYDGSGDGDDELV